MEAGGIQVYIYNKGSKESEHQRTGIKLRNLAFCVWEDERLWSHWIHAFHMLLSYLSGANTVSFFTLLLAFSQLLSNHQGRWQHLLDYSLGNPHSHLEDGNHWLLGHLFINMVGDIFISQYEASCLVVERQISYHTIQNSNLRDLIFFFLVVNSSFIQSQTIS